MRAGTTMTLSDSVDDAWTSLSDAPMPGSADPAPVGPAGGALRFRLSGDSGPDQQSRAQTGRGGGNTPAPVTVTVTVTGDSVTVSRLGTQARNLNSESRALAACAAARAGLTQTVTRN
jgi:hypothetical protein